MSSSSSTHTRSRVQQCSPQPQISFIGFEPFSPSSGASNASGGRPQATQRSLLSEELCNRGGALKQISSASSLVAIDTSSMIDIESASSDSDVDDRMSSETVINPSTTPIEIRTNSAKAMKIKEQVIKNMIAAHEAAEMQRAKAFPTQGNRRASEL